MRNFFGSKGMIEETVWMIVIIAALLTIALFFYNQQSSGIEVNKNVEERVVNEEGISLLLSLSGDKPPYVEKYYAQILADAVLEGVFLKHDKDKAFYGNGIGGVNTTEIIPPLVKKFTNKNWRITVVTPDGTNFYGNPKLGNILYSYEVLIPVPEERAGRIIFEMS